MGLRAAGCGLAVGLLVSGCAVGPDYERPAYPDRLSADWLDGSGGAMDASELSALVSWWDRFEDAALSSLVERALTTNLGLAEARERVVAARARRGVVDADRLAQLDGTGAYRYVETGEDASGFDGVGPDVEQDRFELGVVAGWELDLWGRVARRVEAADASIGFAVEDFRAARVALAAEVAREVVLIRALDAELATVVAGVASDEDALSIASSRLDAGFGDALDVSRAERTLRSNRALLPGLRGDRRAAELRLAGLLGVSAGEVSVVPHVAAAAGVMSAGEVGATGIGVPLVPGDWRAPAFGVPASLLLRRPDLRRAERSLAEATALVGVAEAARYPRVTLSGTLRLGGGDAGDVLDWETYSLGLGPGVSWPLLSGGRISSNVALAKSVRRSSALELEGALVAALVEVEVAAMRHRRQAERVAMLVEAESAAEDTEGLALDRYRAGVSDFLSVTEATTQRLAIQRARIGAERERLGRLIDLYAALGGGWGAGDLEGQENQENQET